MRSIKYVSRAPFASRSLPAAAFRDPEPWEYWLACLFQPSAWLTGKKRCYCDYLENPPLEE
jgi:hypothetical protein